MLNVKKQDTELGVKEIPIAEKLALILHLCDQAHFSHFDFMTGRGCQSTVKLGFSILPYGPAAIGLTGFSL